MSAPTLDADDIFTTPDPMREPDEQAGPKPVVPIQHVADVMKDVIAAIDAGPPKVIPTPFVSLNRLLDGGFRPGEFIFLGARPSIGKTVLALEIARHAAKTEAVLVVSREMINMALGERIIAQDGRVGLSAIRTHNLSHDDLFRIGQAVERISSLKLWMTDAALTLDHIRELASTPPADVEKWNLLVVDYLQLVHPPKGLTERRQQVEAVSQGLKELAVALKIPVLCLASLRRAPAGPQPRPTMSDLKESSGLEHDADVIMLMHRDDPKDGSKNPIIEVNIAKNRSGDTGMRELLFTGSCVSFSGIDYSGRS